MNRKSPSNQLTPLAARQRHHRLRERIRPNVMATADSDPWLIADQALDALDRIRALHVLREWILEDIDEAGELVRRLAHGPENLPSP
jgi:hypothetical protein